MKALVLLHRWLGIGFCLLFAMWFASGIVMHFVPFPSLSDAQRFAGSLPIDPSQVRHGPDEAVAASHVSKARLMRLIQRADGPVYIVSGSVRAAAVRATDLFDASVKSEQLALAIAQAHAHQRGLDTAHAVLAGVADYDQWSVPNGFDKYRPLYRIALNDTPGTELYVSSTTGEVVLAITRHERVWNYVGSVAHWIYPTILRSNAAAWSKTVWTLSLVALIAAVSGVVLGIIGLQVSRRGLQTPFRGWHAWHHVLGLFSATFVLSFIFSGWLSMDSGLLFSSGRLSPAETAGMAQTPDWGVLARDQHPVSAQAREVEWFVLGQRLYRRERTGANAQSIVALNPAAGISHPFLTAGEIDLLVRQIASGCAAPVVVASDDKYPETSALLDAPVYRSVCGDVWYDLDGATGALIERLDPSRRSYRWLYAGLHTLNFPALTVRPVLRSVLIVGLCTIGFLFSITGAVIGWRRLRSQFS
jgi:hypothetical protein